MDDAADGRNYGDPLQPSAEFRARMDQMTAAARELAETLQHAVDELTQQGWTDQQARALITHAITTGGRP
jgi:hypothetical protein